MQICSLTLKGPKRVWQFSDSQQQAIIKLLISSAPLLAPHGSARGLRLHLRTFLKGIYFHNIKMLTFWYFRDPILIPYDNFDADNKEIHYLYLTFFFFFLLEMLLSELSSFLIGQSSKFQTLLLSQGLSSNKYLIFPKYLTSHFPYVLKEKSITFFIPSTCNPL